MAEIDDRWVAKSRPEPAVAAPVVPVLGLASAMFFAACFVAVWLYRSNTGLGQAVFIGEDFPVFWWQAYLDPAGSLVDPYAGYFHLVPRLAGVAAVLNAGASAPFIFLVVYLSALFIAAAALVKSHSLIGLTILAAIAVAPNTGEVFASVTYFQWISAPILVGLYLGGPPADRAGRVAWFLAMLITGFSGPFSALLAPMAAAELLLRHLRGSAWNADRRRLLACVAVMACGSISVVAYVLAGSEQVAGGTDTYFPELAQDAFGQVFALLGQGEFGPARWPAFALLLLVGASVALRPYRWEKLVLAGFGILVAAIAMHKFRFDPVAFESADFGTRYFFLGLVSAITIVVLTAFGDWRGRVLAALALAIPVASYDYAAWRGPDRIPVDWSAQRDGIRAEAWTKVFVNPFWHFVVTRDAGGAQLHWVRQTLQPDGAGPIATIPLTPGKPLRLAGQATVDGVCGFAIPVVAVAGRSAAVGDALKVQVWSRSLSTGEQRQRSFVLPVAGLGDWSTIDVGTGQLGPQEVTLQLDALSAGSLHVALPSRGSSAPWQGVQKDEPQAFPAVVWTMDCTVDSPFGRLSGTR